MRRFSMLAAVLFAFSAVTAAEDDAKKDLEKMQGEWKVTAFEFSGAKIPKEETDKLSVSIKGSELTPVSKTAVTIKLDATTTPRQITLTDKTKTQYGIYEITGDTIKMCLGFDEAGRPKAFATEKDSKTFMLSLEKVKK